MLDAVTLHLALTVAAWVAVVVVGYAVLRWMRRQ